MILMRPVFLMLAFFLSTHSLAQENQQKIKKLCANPEVHGQAGINTCKKYAFDQTEAELNAVYKKIMRVYAEDKIFLRQLKVSQALWLKLREAELSTKYPDYSAIGKLEGSSLPGCEYSYRKQLTLERIAHLKRWLQGEQDGDYCSGSVELTSVLKSKNK